LVASAPSLVAKISGADFVVLANEHPTIWRATALELCRRLDARRKFHRTPNITPRIFIGSSRESLPQAQALKAAVENVAKCTKLDVSVTIWCNRVFGASSFPEPTRFPTGCPAPRHKACSRIACRRGRGRGSRNRQKTVGSTYGTSKTLPVALRS
jgi:hypothetical protein